MEIVATTLQRQIDLFHADVFHPVPTANQTDCHDEIPGEDCPAGALPKTE